MDLTQEKAAFERWWHEEGSGMLPLNGEDAETHAHRVCREAWLAKAGWKRLDKVAEG